MGGGLLVGLSHKDAARFAFLLATPIIGAAALLKLPELSGSQGDGIRGQALVPSLCSAASAYLAVRFLMRCFETRTLIPFGIGRRSSAVPARSTSWPPKKAPTPGASMTPTAT